MAAAKSLLGPLPAAPSPSEFPSAGTVFRDAMGFSYRVEYAQFKFYLLQSLDTPHVDQDCCTEEAIYIFDFRRRGRHNPFLANDGSEIIVADYKFGYVLIDAPEEPWSDIGGGVDYQTYPGQIFVHMGPLRKVKQAEDFRRLVKHATHGWIFANLPPAYNLRPNKRLRALKHFWRRWCACVRQRAVYVAVSNLFRTHHLAVAVARFA